MSSFDLQPGDRVVELTAMLRNCTMLSGLITGAIVCWIIKHKIWMVLAASSGGALLGCMIGTILGPLIYPASNGNVLIAEVGTSTIPLALKGGLSGSILTAVLLAVTISLIFKTPISIGIIPGIAIGLLIGLAFPILASIL